MRFRARSAKALELELLPLTTQKGLVVNPSPFALVLGG